MEGVKFQKRIIYPEEIGTTLKVYHLAERPFGEDHLNRVVYSDTRLHGRAGVASIYEFERKPGATLFLYRPLEGQPDNCFWDILNYENGKPEPPGFCETSRGRS
jgi:hypothetical protein